MKESTTKESGGRRKARSQAEAVNLDAEVGFRRKQISSESMSMSIGELAGLYKDGEIDLHPKFQRFLRWEDGQKSRLIESILLRIPIPPIFVAQDTDGKWDVVDGLQRLGTIFEFLGIYKDPEGKPKDPLVLTGTRLLPALDGARFSTGSLRFSTPLQLDFRRSRLDVNILLRDSDSSATYELFERLNTGGSLASEQEVRNCILVWMNEEMFDWYRGPQVCGNQDFQDCLRLSGRAVERQYDMELALRFFVFREMPEDELRAIVDIGDFLNEHNRAIASSKTFDREAEGRTFAETFRLIATSLEADAFRKYDESRGRFVGPFLISAFEAVAMGVARNLDKWRAHPSATDRLMELVRSMWAASRFTDKIGPGVPARDRVRYTVPFGRDHFVP